MTGVRVFVLCGCSNKWSQTRGLTAIDADSLTATGAGRATPASLGQAGGAGRGALPRFWRGPIPPSLPRRPLVPSSSSPCATDLSPRKTPPAEILRTRTSVKIPFPCTVTRTVPGVALGIFGGPVSRRPQRWRWPHCGWVWSGGRTEGTPSGSEEGLGFRGEGRESCDEELPPGGP